MFLQLQEQSAALLAVQEESDAALQQALLQLRQELQAAHAKELASLAAEHEHSLSILHAQLAASSTEAARTVALFEEQAATQLASMQDSLHASGVAARSSQEEAQRLQVGCCASK